MNLPDRIQIWRFKRSVLLVFHTSQCSGCWSYTPHVWRHSSSKKCLGTDWNRQIVRRKPLYVKNGIRGYSRFSSCPAESPCLCVFTEFCTLQTCRHRIIFTVFTTHTLPIFWARHWIFACFFFYRFRAKPGSGDIYSYFTIVVDFFRCDGHRSERKQPCDARQTSFEHASRQHRSVAV